MFQQSKSYTTEWGKETHKKFFNHKMVFICKAHPHSTKPLTPRLPMYWSPQYQIIKAEGTTQSSGDWYFQVIVSSTKHLVTSAPFAYISQKLNKKTWHYNRTGSS